MSEIKSNRAWREECESLRQRVKELEKEAEEAGAVVLNINAERIALHKELSAGSHIPAMLAAAPKPEDVK